jgi:hypothetical protein
MKRHLINLLTAVSLLLCVAVAALLVRSYWRPVEWAHLPSPGNNWLFETRRIDGE